MTAPEAISTEVTTTVPGAVVVDEKAPPAKADDGQEPFDADRAMKKIREADREAEALRKRLKEFEDRDKTEAQKLAERAETAEKQRDELLIESLRARVALAKGLPLPLAERLRGTTEEEMSADADALLELVPTTSTRPRGDVDQGARSNLPLNGDPLERDLKARLGIA